MQKLMKRLHKSEKGFTLVELMVVVVIIGILVAIAIPVYQGIQANARNSACSANIRTLQGAVAQFYTEVGEYLEDTTSRNVAFSSLWTGYDPGGGADILRFIEEEPRCPWDETVAYTYTLVSPTSYSIGCNNALCANYATTTP